MKKLHALLHCARGTAAVEFAIIGWLLVALCIATIDFGRTYYTKNQISALADRAARKLLLNPDITDAALEAELRDGFSAGDPAELTIQISSDTVGGTSYRVVTIGFQVSLFIPGLDSDLVSLGITRRVPTG